METNRKHGVKSGLPPPTPLRARSLGDLARRYWSSKPLAPPHVDSPRDANVFGEAFTPGSMLPPEPVTASCGPIQIDREQRLATLQGTPLRLTEREFAVLLSLVNRANRLVPRSALLEKIWSLPDDYGSNVVDVYVRRLRRKLGPHSAMIETVRGFGYCLRFAERLCGAPYSQ
jgi:DNA-binding response OmpR family regulator